MIETIVEKIQHGYLKYCNQIIFDYAEVIKLKYKINFKYIKLIENNFSLSKMDFVYKLF